MVHEKVCIVHLEDDPLDAELIAGEIEQVLPDAEVLLVDNETDFLARLKDRKVTLALVDLHIPGTDTLAVIASARQRFELLPIILLSGAVSPEGVTRALEAGATDCVLKDHLGRLGFVLQRALREQRDRLERRRTDGKLIQVQKLEAVGQLAGGLAHDFNNHLSVILGTAEMVLDSGTLEARNRRRLQNILAAGEQASTLVRHMLSLSRTQPTEKGYLDPARVLQDTVELLRPLIPEATALELDCGPIKGRPHLDAGHLDQILMNLVVNASHAIEDRLAVDPRGEGPAGEILIRAAQSSRDSSSFLTITVQDNGTGMDEEIRSQIFNPFFSTKGPGRGTGLGLSVVYNLTTSHGGEISVESRSGQGSTFKLVFPLVAEDQIDPKELKEDSDGIAGDERVLIVDDEPAQLELFQSCFEGAGYRVTTARDGLDALHKVKIGEPPELVITDVRMPDMSGPELVLRLRERNPEMPVIFVSGYTSDLLDPTELERPDTVFLRKPATPATVARRARRLLNQRRQNSD